MVTSTCVATLVDAVAEQHGARRRLESRRHHVPRRRRAPAGGAAPLRRPSGLRRAARRSTLKSPMTAVSRSTTAPSTARRSPSAHLRRGARCRRRRAGRASATRHPPAPWRPGGRCRTAPRLPRSRVARTRPPPAPAAHLDEPLLLKDAQRPRHHALDTPSSAISAFLDRERLPWRARSARCARAGRRRRQSTPSSPGDPNRSEASGDHGLEATGAPARRRARAARPRSRLLGSLPCPNESTDHPDPAVDETERTMPEETGENFIYVRERRLPYETFDADNHLYENKDAFLQFEGVRRRHQVRRGERSRQARHPASHQRVHPEPDVQQGRGAGGYGRDVTKGDGKVGSKVLGEAGIAPGMDASSRPRAAPQVMKDMGHRPHAAVADAGERARGAWRTTPTCRRAYPRPQPVDNEHWTYVYSDATYSTPIISLDSTT